MLILVTDDILRFEDVVAGYGRETILRGLSFNVRRGAITTVIGPNGSGKSTAFKASFGMLPVRHGRIFYDGRNVTNHTPRQLIGAGISYVPQGRNIFPELSVLHNLELGGVAAPAGFDLPPRLEGVLDTLSGVAPQGQAAGLDALRRRAEDAGDRTRADAAAETDADRRAIDRTVADP